MFTNAAIKAPRIMMQDKEPLSPYVKNARTYLRRSNFAIHRITFFI